MFKPSMLGVAKLTYRIANFGPIRKARLQRKFEQQGAELVEKIKAAAPARTGSLRDSVRMVPKAKKPGVLLIAGGTAATSRGPNLDEALLTEFGTRKERAEPFFYTTIRGERRRLEADIKSDLTDPGDLK